MRILSVITQKPHGTGSGTYLCALLAGFAAEGCAQALVAGVCADDPVGLPDGVRFYPVCYESEALPFPVVGMSDEMPYPSTKYGELDDTMTAQLRAAFLTAIERAVAEFRPDLIFCHHLYLLTAMVREHFPDLPVVALCHGSDLRQFKKTARCRDYIQEQIRRLDRIFALHEEQAAEIGSLYGAEPACLAIAGSGFDDDVFYRQPAAERPAGLRLVFAGKITEKKGVPCLLRSLAHLPYAAAELSLCLCGGHGSEREYAAIRELAATARYRVEFPGSLPPVALAREFNRADVFVLPSFFEGLPLVLIEALACGLRVVATDLPGIRPWLDAYVPGHGVVFVPPPRLRNTDEAEADSLDAFERELADAIVRAAAGSPPPADVSAVSWPGVCARILRELTAVPSGI